MTDDQLTRRVKNLEQEIAQLNERRKRKYWLLLLLFIAAAFVITGGVLTKPYTFSAGDTISASQVNANFDALFNLVNGNIDNVNLASDSASLAKVSGGVMAVSEGNVGIGTVSPSYKLDVNGTFSANSINVNNVYSLPTTDGSNGYVLKTNASGVLSWQADNTGEGLTLPYFGTCSGGSGAFSITNTNITGNAGEFHIDNTSGASAAIHADTNGTGNAASIWIINPSNSDDALWVGTDGTGRAAYFAGDVRIDGNLSKSSGSFVIDHPLDPENKILAHSFVESPEMMNIYKGRAKLENGMAEILLPEYFDALNHPEGREITLTPINGWSPLYLEGKIENSQFTVKTTNEGNSEQEFSWVIYAVRNDRFAKENPIIVEQEKGTGNRFKKGELLYYGNM